MPSTLRQLLMQPDAAGLDYEDGLQNATVKCAVEDCAGAAYVTLMCHGSFVADSGKFHNHCRECKGFGKCLRDYRQVHCHGCDEHFFMSYFSSVGGACPRCGSEEE